MSDQELPPKPSYDPGWNDPPTFNYSNTPPPTKTKLNLNKRIAFPMQSSTKTTELPKVEKSSGGLPLPFAKVKRNPEQLTTAPAPIFNHHPPQLPPSIMTIEPKSIENDDQQLKFQQEELLNSHEYVMKKLQEITKTLMPGDTSKVEEIDKRLHILDTMWIDGKINDKLKISLVKIVEALQNSEFSLASDIQRSIIVDHGSNICAQWGTALRQLILMKENESNEPSEIATDASVVDEPKFINTIDGHSDGKTKSGGRVIHI